MRNSVIKVLSFVTMELYVFFEKEWLLEHVDYSLHILHW